MRRVALFVGLALTVGLFATSAASAGLVDDRAPALDEDIRTTQDALHVLVPHPVQQSTGSAFDAALPGEGSQLDPDPSLLTSVVLVPEIGSATSTSIDLATEPSGETAVEAEAGETKTAATAASTPALQRTELPDYVTQAEDASEGDEDATTHGAEHSSADSSASVAEAWDQMETEEKAAAAGALGLLLLGPLTMYSRIQRDDALENDTRREVYEIVEDNPGVCIQEVADQADVSYSTASYHLKRLVRMDYVTRREDGNKVLYYKNGGTFTAEEQELIPVLQNEEAMRVFHHIVENPWCYRAEVAEALDVSHTTVNWHLDRLQDADLVEEHREGRSCHLNVNEETLDRVTATLEKLEETSTVETPAARPQAAAA
jgi:DNA-binding transcriptional ArsR family regulator